MRSALGRLPKQSLLTSACFFAVYLILELRRYVEGLATGYDLGIFTQIVHSYSHLSLPYAPLKGPHYNTLGDHFHPIVALIAPLYRVLGSSVTLLVVQAALVAVSVLPLMQWAREARGPRFALWAGISYGASWGLVEMVWFDFHEVAFAVPLVAFSVCALGRQRWRAAAAWALPLVLAKEDLGLTLAAIGFYIAWRGPRRLGVIIAVVGLAASAIEILVVLPALSPTGHFAYWDSSVSHHASLLAQAAHTFWPPEKWWTTLMVLAPTGLLALRSPLILLALPTLAWRFGSANDFYWGTSYHYSAILMPIAFAAAVQAASSGRLSTRMVRSACALGLTVTTLTVFTHPLGQLLKPSMWQTSPHLKAERALLALIPDGATVESSNRLAAQLAARTTVSEVCLFPRTLPPTQPTGWIIYDGTDHTAPLCHRSAQVTAEHPQVAGYHLVRRQDDITVLQRN